MSAGRSPGLQQSNGITHRLQSSKYDELMDEIGYPKQDGSWSAVAAAEADGNTRYYHRVVAGPSKSPPPVVMPRPVPAVAPTRGLIHNHTVTRSPSAYAIPSPPQQHQSSKGKQPSRQAVLVGDNRAMSSSSGGGGGQAPPPGILMKSPPVRKSISSEQLPSKTVSFSNEKEKEKSVSPEEYEAIRKQNTYLLKRLDALTRERDELYNDKLRWERQQHEIADKLERLENQLREHWRISNKPSPQQQQEGSVRPTLSMSDPTRGRSLPRHHVHYHYPTRRGHYHYPDDDYDDGEEDDGYDEDNEAGYGYPNGHYARGVEIPTDDEEQEEEDKEEDEQQRWTRSRRRPHPIQCANCYPHPHYQHPHYRLAPLPSVVPVPVAPPPHLQAIPPPIRQQRKPPHHHHPPLHHRRSAPMWNAYKYEDQWQQPPLRRSRYGGRFYDDPPPPPSQSKRHTRRRSTGHLHHPQSPSDFSLYGSSM